jgi:hypothetical protein
MYTDYKKARRRIDTMALLGIVACFTSTLVTAYGIYLLVR